MPLIGRGLQRPHGLVRQHGVEHRAALSRPRERPETVEL